MTDIKELSKDVVSMHDYEDNEPIYKKIKAEFENKLKEKYQCEDYDSIVKYVFDFAFKQKIEKSKCIEKLNGLFNNKAGEMMDFLWDITKYYENEKVNQDDNNRLFNYKRGGKSWMEKYKNKGQSSFDTRQKYHSNKQRERSRERSRSYSGDRSDNKYDYENYQNYPVKQKGFYPPKGRFGGPMMPMGGGYPPYYPPQMMPPYMR